MQATIATFDPQSRSGSVLLDDGTQLPFDTAAFDAGGLLGARFGQRVNVELTGAGHTRAVAVLTLATFPLPRTDQSHPD